MRGGYRKNSGRKKGCIPWNKGLTGEEYSKHYEEGHPKGMKGKKHKWGNHSKKAKIKISSYQQGIKVENWKGFKISRNRWLKNTAKYQIWRNAVFLRDNFTCQNPNCEFCKNKQGVFLNAHHIYPLNLFPELAFKIDNGITYCGDFHLKSGLHKEMKIKFMEVN